MLKLVYVTDLCVCADPENGNGSFVNPIANGAVDGSSASPMKMDASLVRVTSMDSGSGNGSNGVVINELSGATSSINMWHVSSLSVLHD